MQNGEISGTHQRCMPKLFLKICHFDAITVAPYMGEDSVTPFLVIQ